MFPATARARSTNRSSATTSKPSQPASTNTSRPSPLPKPLQPAKVGGVSPAAPKVPECTPTPARNADAASKPSVPQLPQVDGAAPSSAAATAEFTLGDLAKQKNFTAINGKVYDLTNFKHPGGPFTIAALKGKDGTSEFKSKHGPKMEKNLKSKGIKLVGVLVK